MNKKSVQRLVVGGAVILGIVSAATPITTIINRNIALQQALKDAQEELDNHKKENEKVLKSIKREKEELQNNLDNALEELNKTIKENNELESKISQIQKETGISDFKKAREVTWEVTYYTDLACENSYEYGGVNAKGEILKKGMVANNNLPLGTTIYIEGYGVKTVEDRGSKRHFSQSNRIDVFIPRNEGETDIEYYTRVNALGKNQLKGYIFEF